VIFAWPFAVTTIASAVSAVDEVGGVRVGECLGDLARQVTARRGLSGRPATIVFSACPR
jgi:hypothetical protein